MIIVFCFRKNLIVVALDISMPLGKINFAFPFSTFMELMISTSLKLYNNWVPGSLGHGPSGQLLDVFFPFLAVEAPLHSTYIVHT